MMQVSILTPTYNQEPYIGRCIESVLAQTFPDWELLIVDDCSTDNTCEVIEKYRDSRIRLIRQPHRGIWKLGETYARAFCAARGPLIAILDGDDFWPPNKLEMQRGAFKQDEVVLSYGSYSLCDRKGEEYFRGLVPAKLCGSVNGNLLIQRMLRNEFLPYSVTVMVRKEALDKIGGFVHPEYLPLVDYPTWLNVICGARCVGFKEILGYYRIHSESVCRTYSPQIDEGQMRYGVEFLDRAWLSMGLSSVEWGRLRRDLDARYSHRRAFREMQMGNCREAVRLFRWGMAVGGAGRRVKSGLRMAQAILRMVGQSAGLRFRQGEDRRRP
jgi:glycosyltransferase involved in cell wall biosynthesis